MNVTKLMKAQERQFLITYDLRASISENTTQFQAHLTGSNL